MSKARFFLLPICLVVLLLIQTCNQDILEELLATFGDPVVVDPPDKTPPIVSLVFFDPNSGKKIVLKSGDPSKTIPIKKSDRCC